MISTTHEPKKVALKKLAKHIAARLQGDNEQIARKTGISYNAVTLMLNGHPRYRGNVNHKVAAALVEVVSNRTHKIKVGPRSGMPIRTAGRPRKHL